MGELPWWKILVAATMGLGIETGGRRKLGRKRRRKRGLYISKGKLVKITFSSSGHMGYCGLYMLNPI